MLNVNEYFDGKVKSIAFEGVIYRPLSASWLRGSIHLAPAKKYMTVVSGELQVKLPGSDHFVSFTDGKTFEVDADQSFDLIVPCDTAYLCKYE